MNQMSQGTEKKDIFFCALHQSTDETAMDWKVNETREKKNDKNDGGWTRWKSCQFQLQANQKLQIVDPFLSGAHETK